MLVARGGWAGGGDRVRTDDLLRARQPLSQLSYAPWYQRCIHLVGIGRLELPTSRLSGVRSNQLSYIPEWNCDLSKTGLGRTLKTE